MFSFLLGRRRLLLARVATVSAKSTGKTSGKTVGWLSWRRNSWLRYSANYSVMWSRKSYRKTSYEQNRCQKSKRMIKSHDRFWQLESCGTYLKDFLMNSFAKQFQFQKTEFSKNINHIIFVSLSSLFIWISVIRLPSLSVTVCCLHLWSL